jgi:hypothetical protein
MEHRLDLSTSHSDASVRGTIVEEPFSLERHQGIRYYGIVNEACQFPVEIRSQERPVEAVK